MTIGFGTDGWRGVISREFTFNNVRRVAAAIGSYLIEERLADKGVAVGYDRRFLSGEYAAEAAGVLGAMGIPTKLAPKDAPTPLVSWAVKKQDMAGGIMITASHNPPQWNGVKFKESFGGSSRGVVNKRIEKFLLDEIPDGSQIKCLSVGEMREKGLADDLNADESYAAGVKSLIDFDAIRKAKLKVAVDCMHGCGTPWIKNFLLEAGCEVVELHAESNPGFRGVPPEPIGPNLGELMNVVAKEKCDLGLATDGDADRIGAVDERGENFSSQRIFASLLRYAKEVKGLDGDVAKTVSATSMIDLLAEKFGMDIVLTPIGFKYIGEIMLERDILIGGEESGGIGLSAHLPERDGILNALLLTELVAKTGKGLRAYIQETFNEIGYFTYDRIDVHLDPATMEKVRVQLTSMDGVDRLGGRSVTKIMKLDGIKFLLNDWSWLLLRPSGTEPVLRLYAEGRSKEDVKTLLAEGRRLVGL